MALLLHRHEQRLHPASIYGCQEPYVTSDVPAVGEKQSASQDIRPLEVSLFVELDADSALRRRGVFVRLQTISSVAGSGWHHVQ
jgi:hypothetical protein